jgi:hypothetical protein
MHKPSSYTLTIFILIVLLILVSGYAIWRFLSTTNRTRFTEIMMCDKCKYIFELTHSAKETAPYLCEKCKERKAYKAYFCRKCGIYFPGKTLDEKGNAECTKCFDTRAVIEIIHLPPQSPEAGASNGK